MYAFVNIWMIEGLFCKGAGIKILGADRKILNADGNFLGAYFNFLLAGVVFLKPDENLLVSGAKSLGVYDIFKKVEGSFLLADGNSLRDVVNFLK